MKDRNRNSAASVISQHYAYTRWYKSPRQQQIVTDVQTQRYMLYIHEPESSDSPWGASSHAFVDAKHTSPAGLDDVLCAVDMFGQDTIFQWTKDFNGYCLRDSKKTIGK